MKYIVVAYYPNLGIKARMLDFDKKTEMYEYVGGLRLTDTPYTIHKIHKGESELVEMEQYGLSNIEMAELLKMEFAKE